MGGRGGTKSQAISGDLEWETMDSASSAIKGVEGEKVHVIGN